MLGNALVIDTDLDDRLILSSKLQEAGWNVIQSIIYHDAKMFIPRKDIGLIVCNNLIPTVNDGKKFVNELRTQNKDAYIMIISPIRTQSTISDFLTLGVNDYIVKPLDVDIFLWRLSLKFKGLNVKDFAKINLQDQDSNICYFDVKAEVAGLAESFVDFLLPYYVEPKSSIIVSSDFLRSIGVKSEQIDVSVIDIQKYTANDNDNFKFIARCSMDNLDEESSMAIRRWLIANRV